MTTPAGRPLRRPFAQSGFSPRAALGGLTSTLTPWPKFDARRLEPERMDDPRLDAELHFEALAGLRRINAFSVTVRSFWRPIARLAGGPGGRPLRVLDVGAGGGDLVIAMQRRADQARLPAHFHGCDHSPRAIEYAKERADEAGVDAEFFVHDVLAGSLPDEFDVILCNLLLHHFTDAGIVSFLRCASKAAGSALLASDLLRSRRGFALAWAGTRVLSRSPVVHADGPQSVRAALTIDELANMAGKAGLSGVRIRRCFPCRMMMNWSRA